MTTVFKFLIIWVLLNITTKCGGENLLTENDEERMHPDLVPFDTSQINSAELNSEYWIENAQKAIKEKLAINKNEKKAKNIIFFLGDGMSVHTLTATRAYLKDVSHQLSFEKFPYVGLSKTYCVNAQVADSACSATAYFTGVKNNIDMIGVTAEVESRACDETKVVKNRVDSIAKWAQDSDMSTGIVTTTRVTHATPAGTYASIAHRDWECDTWISEKCKSYSIKDIAYQLIHGDTGKNFKVILGGGRSLFLNESMRGEEGETGTRQDGKNLIQEWLDDKKKQNINAKYIWNRKELLSTDTSKIDYLLGLFSPDHLPYHGDRIRSFTDKGDPSLSEMTETALKILSKNSNGFFLLVEGGRIDHAHHYVKARKALEETVEFANAVEIANKMFDGDDETLIIVTSDHSHTMTVNGYPNRNSNILGLSDSLDDKGKKYAILSYANGDGFYTIFPKNGTEKRDIERDDFEDAEYNYPSHVPLEKETHGGEDVAIFAKGPQAQLFVGNYEQSYIPILLAKIAQIGPYKL
ncbi:membrane-bound alkaline phosphatase-like [Condylostylus longicornis]|uniref:membrane-bound alkaline phosphatase-like n=1 Tax=Condylostylus longicornis TaxID=2530218 RepID=UPI00244E043F|nr:membrane-bound alkaline phosphatase-like [Condylostylus longicornis]